MERAFYDMDWHVPYKPLETTGVNYRDVKCINLCKNQVTELQI